tara:strand:+ start:18 stop:1187 length:1170 start_codon:yes stop_codon:yes gene_type:complete
MKKIILLGLVTVVAFSSCKKKGCMDPNANNYNTEAEKDDGSCTYDPVVPTTPITYTVPTTYTFTDASGNNTVSYGGQTARLDMLGEMTSYLKTANGSNSSPASLSASDLLAMYDNSYTGWSDQTLVGNGKQLKSKTALGDAGVQGQFETWMNEVAAASPDTSSGYLQAASGHEWTQLIEKGLMSACFVSQMTGNYLAGIASDDNTTAVDSANGKHYTEMEHHWDEAYGYFTSATDYPTSGTNRFWGKYANNTLESVIGSATTIATAFRTGRAAISAGATDDALAQAAIIEAAAQQMVAGMAIHYLNSTKDKVAAGETQNKVNHYLSEAYAFIYGIQFVNNSPMGTNDVTALLTQIDTDFVGFSNSVPLINAVIDQIAAAFDLTSVKDQL